MDKITFLAVLAEKLAHYPISDEDIEKHIRSMKRYFDTLSDREIEEENPTEEDAAVIAENIYKKYHLNRQNRVKETGTAPSAEDENRSRQPDADHLCDNLTDAENNGVKGVTSDSGFVREQDLSEAGEPARNNAEQINDSGVLKENSLAQTGDSDDSGIREDYIEELAREAEQERAEQKRLDELKQKAIKKAMEDGVIEEVRDGDNITSVKVAAQDDNNGSVSDAASTSAQDDNNGSVSDAASTPAQDYNRAPVSDAASTSAQDDNYAPVSDAASTPAQDDNNGSVSDVANIPAQNINNCEGEYDPIDAAYDSRQRPDIAFEEAQATRIFSTAETSRAVSEYSPDDGKDIYVDDEKLKKVDEKKKKSRKKRDSVPGTPLFWTLFIITLPITLPLALSVAACFGVAYACVTAVIVSLSAAMVACVAVGTALSLVGIIYGVTQSFKILPIGLFEIGFGIALGGATMLISVLLYNIAIRFTPKLYRYVTALAKLVVEKLSDLYYTLKKECGR